MAQDADRPRGLQMLQFLYKLVLQQSILELLAPHGSGGRSAKSCSNVSNPLQTLYKTAHFGASGASWLRRQIASWLAGWLAGWLAAWLAGWLAGSLAGSTDRPTDRLTDRPTNSCISQLGYTLANQEPRAPTCMHSTWHPTFLPLRAEMWEQLFEFQAGCSLPSILFRNKNNRLGDWLACHVQPHAHMGLSC